MRSRIYRNLDMPFRVLGFNYAELAFICVFFVVGNELAQLLSIPPAWVILTIFLVAISWSWIRYSLGDNFGGRFVRFISLPKQLQVRLFSKWRQNVQSD